MTYHPGTIIHTNGWFNTTRKLMNIPEPCCISVDNPHFISSTLPNIFIQVEPNVIINNEEYLIKNKHKYHTIFTYNQNVLDNCTNAKKYIVGTTWINKSIYNSIDIMKKEFKISNFVGSKDWTIGHRLRILIHENQYNLKEYPITFFRSSVQIPHRFDYGNNPFIGTKTEDKIMLFETFQFAIVIENTKQKNCFTEKIMDCLLTKTIPIYWGCSNIGDYFDITGWIILETESIDEVKEKLKILTPDYYTKYTDIIEKNHSIAKKYVDLYDNLNNAI